MQQLRKTVRRTDTLGEANPLTGLIYCADCGAKMYNHRGGAGWARDWHGRPNGKRRPDRDEYVCSTYNLDEQNFKSKCTRHSIETEVVKNLILTAICRVNGYVRMNEDEFVQKVREASKIQQVKTAKECKRRIREAQKRYNELDGMVKKLYESYAAGKLPDRHYQRLLAEYDAEQAGVEKTTVDLWTELESFNADSVRAEKFIELVKRYIDFTELTTPMLNEFVEKILVHEADKSTDKRIQQVDI